MKCGVAIATMNSRDWERVNANDWSHPPVVPDHEVWNNSIRIGDMVEPLGFDSLWSGEHFATPYGMAPSSQKSWQK